MSFSDISPLKTSRPVAQTYSDDIRTPPSDQIRPRHIPCWLESVARVLNQRARKKAPLSPTPVSPNALARFCSTGSVLVASRGRILGLDLRPRSDRNPLLRLLWPEADAWNRDGAALRVRRFNQAKSQLHLLVVDSVSRRKQLIELDGKAMYPWVLLSFTVAQGGHAD